ncbi:MAG: peroxide stress protein YaaA [Rhodospirillales bacterium]|jgi:cytoplasmic iron level regulating protein YaaA (DUF328/UPF0246 family)
MLALVSPAKKMDFKEPARALLHTDPDFFSDTKKLIKAARQLSQSEIQQLMNLSDGLSELSFERFKAFKAKQTQTNAKQAALAFAGDTYLGLDAATLSDKEFDYAQNHLRILSGLYGLLRPLDLIQPYRLEMGRRLNNERGSNLYEFWGDKLAKSINNITKDHQNSAVINLASNEYFKAAQQRVIKSQVVTPVFKEIKAGESSVIGFLAKKARGSMARYIVQNKIETPEELKSFTKDRYKFQKNQSDDTTWVYSRKFTPVGG